MRAVRSSKAALDVCGLITAAILFAVAAELHPPTQNVFLGIATSFIFLSILDVLLVTQKGILNRARTKFFGSELIHEKATFVYPDFEPHREVRRALDGAGIKMRYQRPTSKIRALGDFWIDAPNSAASNDIEAILHVASIFGGLAAQPDAMMSDRRLIEACDRSYVSFGLASSACTYLYLERAGQESLFDLVPEYAGIKARMFARTSDGREFHSDNHNQYGLIVRYSPDRERSPGRRWFFIGGLGPQGTIGAAWYLTEHWRTIARRVPASQDFVAFVCVPVIAPRSAYLDDADICTSTFRSARSAVAAP